ncbi:MAG: hypothetical protein JWQ90_3676 [Hydrocarboniphaga sp.]|uniref:hypothetical protein n=1 Tax=Hydrocarboniphaga sp. TaxID=2033016 RepID=UPI002628B1F4|nr:hypothetical protein [Hydrocarboniphaga sp.]MDB5971226.1 hypothetical protein [Hydrocarboniphaga sp.]
MSDDKQAQLQLLDGPGKLPQLKRAFNQTNDALSALRVEAGEYMRRELEIARQRIALEVLESFGSREAQLTSELLAIETALEDEKDSLARAGISSAPRFANSPAPPPVGTVMIEDEEAISRLKRTPRRARVAIVNRDTFDEASNKLRAGLGDVVLQIIRPDGTLTSEYAPMDRYRWKPEV